MNRFREFPAELQLEVLSHLSTGDLRNVSLVSVALLRLSGSLLYKNIKLMGLSHAAELFVRVETKPTDLSPYTSLAQTRTITLFHSVADESHKTRSRPWPVFHPSRAPAPLALDRLTIYRLYLESASPIRAIEPLLELFSPATVHLQSTADDYGDDDDLLGRFPLSDSWSRLTRLTCVNAIPSNVNLHFLARVGLGLALQARPVLKFDIQTLRHSTPLLNAEQAFFACPPLKTIATALSRLLHDDVGRVEDSLRIELHVSDQLVREEVERWLRSFTSMTKANKNRAIEEINWVMAT